MQRKLSLDLIKIVAMLMVLALHIGVNRHFSHLEYREFPEIYMFAGIAIPLFFMCSGYLMSLKDCVDIGYSVKKIRGIVIFCFVICLLYDLLSLVRYGTADISFPKCFLQYGKFSVFWYFGTMIIIYSILPLLHRIMRSNKFSHYILYFVFFEFVIFALNYKWHFECHVIQTFRLWHHVFYFLCGAYVRKHVNLFKIIDYKVCILSCVLFVYSSSFLKVGGNEYHFGSPFCMFYAISLFVCLERLNIDSHIVKAVSITFLPVYSLHNLILERVLNNPYIIFPIEKNVDVIPIAFFIEYVLMGTLCVLIGFIIMKLPILKSIFRI